MEEYLEGRPEEFHKRIMDIVALTDEFCEKYLNDEYKKLCREMTAAVCSEESPALRGSASSWACGIVYTLGWVNFLFDPGQTPHIISKVVMEKFGVSEGTMRAKFKILRDAFELIQFHPYWCLPSLYDQNPYIWFVEQKNGLIVDIRTLPREVQEEAFKEGIIPYIPADKKKGMEK